MPCAGYPLCRGARLTLSICSSRRVYGKAGSTPDNCEPFRPERKRAAVIIRRRRRLNSICFLAATASQPARGIPETLGKGGRHITNLVFLSGCFVQECASPLNVSVMNRGNIAYATGKIPNLTVRVSAQLPQTLKGGSAEIISHSTGNRVAHVLIHGRNGARLLSLSFCGLPLRCASVTPRRGTDRRTPYLAGGSAKTNLVTISKARCLRLGRRACRINRRARACFPHRARTAGAGDLSVCRQARRPGSLRHQVPHPGSALLRLLRLAVDFMRADTYSLWVRAASRRARSFPTAAFAPSARGSHPFGKSVAPLTSAPPGASYPVT